MYHLDPVEDANRYGDAEEAREELARKEHEAHREYMIHALMRNPAEDAGYVSGDRWIPYQISQHACDQLSAVADLRNDLFRFLAACDKSADPAIRIGAQSILARIGDAYADDQEDA